MISRARLVELEAEIFEQGRGTVEDAAADISRDELVATIRAARVAMRDTLMALPDGAFTAQPPDAAGAPVWSAGEIVAHITEAMLWLQFGLRRLAGENPAGEPPDKPEIAVRDRSATLALLDRADRELDLALTIAAPISDDARTTLGPLGDLGPRGLLLLHAMHEWDHAQQVAALG